MLKGALPPGSFVRNVGWLAGGTALGQGIAVIASPLLTRLYSPEHFGVLAVFASLLGMLSVVASLRYEQAVPLPSDDSEAVGVLILAIILVGVTGAFVALLIWLFPTAITQLLNAEQLLPYLWLLPLGIVTTGAYQALSSWVIREKAFPRLARTKLNQGVGLVGSQIFGGLLNLGSLGLISGHLVGQAAGIATLGRLVWPRIRDAAHPITAAFQSAVRYKQFMLVGTPSALMNSAAMQLPSLLLASLYGVESAGLYLLSRRVIGAPLDLVGRSVGQVYLGEAAPLARTSVAKMRELFTRTAKRLVLFSILPAVIFSLFSPWLFAFAFGDLWHQAGVFAQVLTFMLVAQFIGAPLSQTFVILERQHFSLGLNALKAIIAISAFFLPASLGLSATSAVLYYSLGMSLYYLLVILLSLRLMDTVIARQGRRTQ